MSFSIRGITMPKIIPPEIKNQVIDNHLLGTTRDENAEKACISTGAVSAVLAQFSIDIGEANYEALTRYVRSLRENNMDLRESIEGFHIMNSIKRLGVDLDKLRAFITEVYLPYKDSSLTPSELIQNTKGSVEFLKLTKMTPNEMEEHNDDLLNKKQDLEKQNSMLEENAMRVERETESIQKQNKITLEKIANFEQTRKDLEKNGVSVDDLPKLAKMLTAAEKNNWNYSKIYDYLIASEDYERKIIENKRELNKINKESNEKRNQISLLDKKITFNELHLKKLESKIKTLKNQEIELKASISTTTTFSLNQIKTIKKKAIDYISDVQSVHLDSLNALNNNLIEKSDQVTKKQKNELEEITSNLDKFISEMIKSAENAGNLKALAPFHKILASKGETHEIYPSMITILERFEFWYQKQDNKNTSLPSIIDELISIIKNHLNQ